MVISANNDRKSVEETKTVMYNIDWHYIDSPCMFKEVTKGDCFQEKKIIQAAYSFEQTRTYKHCPLAEKEQAAC